MVKGVKLRNVQFIHFARPLVSLAVDDGVDVVVAGGVVVEAIVVGN